MGRHYRGWQFVLAGVVMVVGPTGGWATEQPATANPPSTGSKRIEVTGSRISDISDRLNETAGKIIVGRDELDRFGENNVGSLLRRLPGISYTGKPGRPGEIKMRGMGGGYTQILIDGEKMPPRAGRAASVDMLPVDMIERIEIVRSAVAEHSAQAIAGTINIVLREDARKSFTTLRAGVNGEAGHLSPHLSFQKSGKGEGVSFTLAGSINRRALFDDGSETTHSQVANGAVLEDRTETTSRRGHGEDVSLSPRISWRLSGGHQLSLTPYLLASRSSTQGDVTLDQRVGMPVFAVADQQNKRRNQMWRLTGNWVHKAADGQRVTARLGGYQGLYQSERLRTERDTAGQVTRLVDDDGSTRYQGVSFASKWSTPWGDDHTLSAGLDGSLSLRREQRTILENGQPSRLEDGAQLNAREHQLAGFVQDEWEVSSTWSFNTGVRWERVQLQADDHGNTRRNDNQVLSPSLHALWRFDDEHGQQLRFSVARTFKTPNLSDLSTRLVESNNNSPISPDGVGNLALQPELSWGYDLAYERYLPENGLLSANLFLRDIRDLIRHRTTLQGGRWVRQPMNVGKARSYGAELEAKTRLDTWLAPLPAIELKANYSRLFSVVSDLNGPDNRLDEQPKQLANLGGDYRFVSLPISVGLNVSWTDTYHVQASEQQRVKIAAKQTTDLYVVWHANRDTKVRATVGNLEQRDQRRNTTSTSADGVVTESGLLDPTRMNWSISLETKF
ncbi:TonB-dependent receptor [Chitinivorax sp. B]|uniref:TonB-dependent receptor plug domain-containing protein n=1 Tax=Chitinivorax sp. B TaxID=2502235 RepID=UPI0010F5A86F|nr:TonB-dependent receptor [Chitinivorax sp. B]